uniref:Uncharacterized protein n=1 Tax=Anguilla anguilla TaxID=7936 RepID=A0A0E9XEY2_ANGAN
MLDVCKNKHCIRHMKSFPRLLLLFLSSLSMSSS